LDSFNLFCLEWCRLIADSLNLIAFMTFLFEDSPILFAVSAILFAPPLTGPLTMKKEC